jgi:hypothetical protein
VDLDHTPVIDRIHDQRARPRRQARRATHAPASTATATLARPPGCLTQRAQKIEGSASPRVVAGEGDDMTRPPLLLALLFACRSPQEAPRVCGDCQSGSAAPGYPSVALRTYKVPDGQEKLVERLLDGTTSYPVSVVSAQGQQTQFVNPRRHFTGNGYFVLSAPDSIHEGVRQLLDELGKHPAPPAQPSIDATYWLVLGWPGKEAPVPDRLGEIAPALKTLGNLGPMRFELLERVELVALDGQTAHARGQNARIEQTAARDGAMFQLRINVDTQGETVGKVETTVTVKPGQFAIFGQSGFVPTGATLAEPKPTLFYVVHAQTAS